MDKNVELGAASIVEVVAEYAKRTPDILCAVDEQGSCTYEKMWEKACRLACFFEQFGVKKRDRIVVECTQDIRFLICKLACELAGAIFVPTEQGASQERVKMIVEDTDAKLFVYRTDYDVEVDKLTFDKVFSEAEKLNGEKMAGRFPQSGDTAEILYTTGTTGKSKGIEITNANNIALAENVKYGTEMKKGNVELIPLPLSHSHGLRCCYANLLNGSTIVIVDGVTKIKCIFQMIEKYQVTALDLSPSAVLVLEKLSKGRFREIAQQIDYIQVGTAILGEEAKEILIENFPDARLYNFYGSTESGRTCVLNFNEERKGAGCIGCPTKNAVFIVTDEARVQIVSSREHMGLLASAGAMNMRGYWKQPELTEEMMQNGYVYTNDVGYIDEDGFIFVLGRKDDIINYKGIKIAPEEIEEKVLKYPDIIDCACVPKDDRMSGQIPKLFVVVRDEVQFSKKELILFLKQYIDENKMPREIELIREIPRTYNGKIQRAKLLDM